MATIREILLFLDQPLDRRNFDRFGVATLEKAGFVVRVWDFTPCLYPEVERLGRAPEPPRPVRSFASVSEAASAVSSLGGDAFVVWTLGLSARSLPILRALSRGAARYGVMTSQALPTGPARMLALADLPGRLKRATPAGLANALFNRIPFGALGVKPAALLIVGGEKSLGGRRPVDASTEIVWAHTMDYDLYLARKDEPEPAGEPIAVFYDAYAPFHTDYLYTGGRPFATADRYFPAIRAFFDGLEARLKLEVVIAAHPRSEYDKHPEYFGGRRTVKGETLDLTRRARLVITHGSTAINFAVLFGKPVVFLTTDELKETMRPIGAMAASLGKTPLDVSAPYVFDEARELAVDPAAYAAYRRDYIKKPGSPERPFWEIAAERIGALR